MPAMKVSFDGLRMNIASNWNNLCQTLDQIDFDNLLQRERDALTQSLSDMRSIVMVLMACHDPDCPDDANDLSDTVTLLEARP